MKTVQEALDALGPTIETVLARLRDQKITARTKKRKESNTQVCPIAVYLQKETGENRFCGTHSTWIYATEDSTPLPAPVMQFISAYDHGCHPEFKPRDV